MSYRFFAYAFLLIFPLFSFVLAISEQDQEMFAKANVLYKEGKFQEAMQLYKKISQKTPQVNYNLGNCAYKLNLWGYALLFWRRAESQWGILNRSELLENIRLLKDKITETMTGKKSWQNRLIRPFVWLKDYPISLIRSAPIFFYQISFLIMWFFLFLFLSFLYKKKNKIIIITMFFFLLMFGVALGLRHRFDLSKYGVVVAKKAALLSGPSDSFQQLGFVPQAKEVIISKGSGDFFKIKFKGQVGWMKKDNVEKIEQVV